MANENALTQKLVDSAAIEFTTADNVTFKDPFIEAMADTDESGTENVTSPNRVVGWVNTAGGHTITFDTSIPVDIQGTNYPPYRQWSASKEVLSATQFLGTSNNQRGFLAATGQTFTGVRVSVNTTTGTPAKHNVTLTAVDAGQVVNFPVTA